MRILIAPLVAALLLAACGRSTGPVAGSAPAVAPAVAVAVEQSLPLAQGVPAGAVLWLHPVDPARSLFVGAAGEGGLVWYAMDGKPAGTLSEGVFDFIALTYGFDAGAAPQALLLAHDRAAGGLRAFQIDPDSLALSELTAAVLPIGEELTGLCLYRSALTSRVHAFAATDSGSLQQWELYTERGRLRGRMVRSIPVGAGTAYCVADDVTGHVYLADEAVGIWRLSAEPESDVDRALLDLVTPRGQLGGQVKGLALHRSATTTRLLAADEDSATVQVYGLPEGRLVGRFSMAGVADAKFESIWAGGFAAAPHQTGVVLVADDPESGNPAYRVLRWDAVAQALQLPQVAPLDPRVATPSSVRTVEASVETEPVMDHGDAADDPAIWVHPDDPARSRIIAAQKKRGIEVYDLVGRRVQQLADGRMNNVDLRQNVQLGGRPRDIVAASNRTHRLLSIYEVDRRTGMLRDAAANPIPTGMRDPYGLCMYRSAASGKLYVFINNSDHGEFRQWELEASADRIGARLVREFAVGTQAEGCAADDATGALYVAEEDVGLWRYKAEPDGGAERVRIDHTGKGGRLEADVEGVAILPGADGKGFLVVSNQGADNYALYRREGDNAFIGHFSVIANDDLGIDGASETDGLDVTASPLGPAFPHGLLVVQDGRNIAPAERQNFKLVPWEQVAAALGL
jgi:3-phytase